MSLQSFLNKLAEAAERNDSSVSAKADVNAGDRDDSVPPQQLEHSSGVVAAFTENHGKLLDRIFAQMGLASGEAKSDVKKVLSGKYESRAPLLNTKLAISSLMERVESIVGRK